MIGQTLSHYRIVERLGQGGMGVVYLAEDTVLGRRVAIKTLTETDGSDRQHFRSRFLREARAVSALSHPHIATIHDYGETPEGQPFIVMEYVKGMTLSDLIRSGSLSIARSLEIIIDVAEALAEAHRLGIVHRDIKPSNVAISDRDEVKVLDFGLAKQLNVAVATSDPEAQTLVNTQTREGVVVGTPMYLSPEQAMGQPVDARSDLFALGSLLYECVAGAPAFAAPSAVEICAKIIRDDPSPPSQFNSAIPALLDQVTLKALAKKPADRYQSAVEMIAGLQSVQELLKNHSSAHHLTQRLGTHSPTTHGFSTISDIFTRPRLSVGYVVLGLLLVGFAAIALWYGLRPRAHQPKSEALQFYNRGVAALREGSFLTASKQLKLAVQTDPDFAIARARLAEAWTELDYSDLAKDELLSVNSGARLSLSSADELYLDAITATVKRDFAAAIKSYSQLSELHPNDSHAFVDLGRAYEKNEETEKAITSFKNATKLDPNSPAAYLHLGALYFRKENRADAEDAFAKAEQIYQDATNLEGKAEVLWERGILFKESGDLKRSGELFQQALEIARIADSKSHIVKTKLQLSSVMSAQGKTAEGKQQASEAVEIARNNGLENLSVEGLIDLGYAFFVSRAYSDAELYFRQALDVAQRNKGERNGARALMSLGSLYIQQEQPDNGVPLIERALNFYRAGSYRREIAKCLLWLGRAQLLRGDFDGAIKSLNEQLLFAKQVDDPAQMARSQEELASVLGKVELYPQALERYTDCYERYKLLGNSFHTAFCLLNRADMLAQLGEYSNAEASLDELMPLLAGLGSDNKYKGIWTAWAYLIRGQMGLRRGDLADAKTHCGEALEVMSDNRSTKTEVSIKATLGLVQVYSGSAAGLKLCKDAATLAGTGDDHSDADAQLALAEGLMHLGMTDQAMTAAKSAQMQFAKNRRRESEWLAWSIIARTSGQLGDKQLTDDAIEKVRQTRDFLRNVWGEQAFANYDRRDDIKRRLTLLGLGEPTR